MFKSMCPPYYTNLKLSNERSIPLAAANAILTETTPPPSRTLFNTFVLAYLVHLRAKDVSHVFYQEEVSDLHHP